MSYHIFWGGADIDPSFYDKPRSKYCGKGNKNHDKTEIEQAKKYIQEGAFLIGICRGAQLLNIVNGGILIQHIEDHSRYHDIISTDGSIGILEVSSTHHQAMIPTKEGTILFKGPGTDGVHWDNVNDVVTYPYINEIIWYPKTKCLCIQPHPEMLTRDHPLNQWIRDFTQAIYGKPIHVFEEYYGIKPLPEKQPEIAHDF